MSGGGYAPSAGDVVWLSFSPTAGLEQASRHPALVLSPAAYNARLGLALCCPITSQVKGHPFEVAVPAGLPVEGAVLADQVRSVDWHSGHAELACRAPKEVLPAVMSWLAVLHTLPE